MTRYILTMTLDNEPPGTDVTDSYKLPVLMRLVDEGYVEAIDDDDDDIDELEAHWPDVAEVDDGD